MFWTQLPLISNGNLNFYSRMAAMVEMSLLNSL